MKKNGGEYVASGTYGCVYRPAIPCYTKVKKGSIGKLMKTIDAANEEIEIVKKLKKLDKKQQFLLYPSSWCNVSNEALQKENLSKCPVERHNGVKELIMPDGGMTLDAYRKTIKTASMTRLELVKITYNLFKGVKLLADNSFIHQDIKLDNIMYSPRAGARLIDFGLMIPKQDLYEPVNEFMTVDTDYPISPPEYRFVLKPGAQKPQDLYLDERKRVYDYCLATEFTYEDQVDGLTECYNMLMKLNTSSKRRAEFSKYALTADVYSLGQILLSFVQYKLIQKENDPDADAFDRLLVKMLQMSPTTRCTIDEALQIVESILRKNSPSKSSSKKPSKEELHKMNLKQIHQLPEYKAIDKKYGKSKLNKADLIALLIELGY